MPSSYRVFMAMEVIQSLNTCTRAEKATIARFLDGLAENPFRSGDYVEQDDIGRPIQVVIIGRRAIFFWVDHAVKEIKIIDSQPAGG